MKRRQLEILLSSLKVNPRPKLRFEEYNLDPQSASTMLYIALSQGDLLSKEVIDLGCGNGILSIGAAILGAKRVVGVDIDVDSIGVAKENAKNLNVRVDFASGSIECVRGAFDTTIMNPPFGSWNKGLDVRFLEKAIGVSEVVYSIHKASNTSRSFLSRKVEGFGRETRRLGQIQITLPRLYEFHQKAKYKVSADLYRIVAKSP